MSDDTDIFPKYLKVLMETLRYPEIPRKYVCILGISDVSCFGDTKDFLLCNFLFIFVHVSLYYVTSVFIHYQ